MDTKTDYFQILSEKLKLQIFSYLDWREIHKNISHVALDWRRLCKDPTLFTSLEIHEKDSPDIIIEVLMKATLLEELTLIADVPENPNSFLHNDKIEALLTKCNSLRKLTMKGVYNSRLVVNLKTNNCKNLTYLSLKYCDLSYYLQVNSEYDFSHLKFLKIKDCECLNKFLMLCSVFGKLTTLDLETYRCRNGFNNKTIRLISKLCPRLIELSVKCRRLSNKGLLPIADHLIKLKVLKIEHSGKYQERAFKGVKSICKNLNKLQILKARGIGMCDAALEESNLNNLQILDLRGSNVTSAGIESVAVSLSKLKVLNLSSTRLSDEGIKSICNNMTGLKILLIVDLDVADEGIRSISKNLKKLEWLDITFCDLITNEGIKSVSNLNKLKTLSLRCCYVNDDGIGFISKSLQNLQRLDIGNCGNITDDGIISLSNNLENLQILLMRSGKKVTDEGIKSISNNLKNLQALDISFCQKVSDEGIKFISFNLHKLQMLDISFCEKVTDEGIRSICIMNELQGLKIIGCDLVTEEGKSVINDILKFKESRNERNDYRSEAGLALKYRYSFEDFCTSGGLEKSLK